MIEAYATGIRYRDNIYWYGVEDNATLLYTYAHIWAPQETFIRTYSVLVYILLGVYLYRGAARDTYIGRRTRMHILLYSSTQSKMNNRRRVVKPLWHGSSKTASLVKPKPVKSEKLVFPGL